MYGHLIVQKKSNHGVKNILEKTFNDFLQMRGYNDYRFCLEYAQNLNQLTEMLTQGELKEINLIENKIKSTFEAQLLDLDGIDSEGNFERSIKFTKRSNVSNYKKVLFGLYKTNYHDYEKVNLLGQDFDEVSFVINHRAVSKTFYVKDKSKTRSDIDVTRHLDFVAGEPTTKSLILASWKLIRQDVVPDENQQQQAS